MAAGKYLKVIWMYAIGIVLVFAGLYMIAFMPSLASSGPTGFGMMLAGLMLSLIGGIYGKKKLLEVSGESLPSVETKQIDQLKQNVVSQLKPPETAETPSEEPKIEEMVPEPVAAKPMLSQQPVARPSIQQVRSVPVRPAPVQPVPSQPVLPATDGVVKVLLCPGCNMENTPANMFCSNCGRRLHAPEKKARPKSRKKAARKKSRKAKPVEAPA